MSGAAEDLMAHLAEGVTTTCRAWALTRADGHRMGFTDHDGDLFFDDLWFRADTGITARALAQSTGLSVDNTEAAGALSADGLTEADILAGRYDGAEVVCWLMDWQDVSRRMVLFRGSIGEVVRAGAEFRADLRGLAEALNRPEGRVYQRTCSAVLGDGACGVDLTADGMAAERAVEEVSDGRVFGFSTLGDFDAGWFARGRFRVLTGAAEGLIGQVKRDGDGAGLRRLELWQELRADVAPGDVVRIEAGCDKLLSTCRGKFDNVANFRGCPHIPGEDWVTGYPRRGRDNDGSSYLRLPGSGS